MKNKYGLVATLCLLFVAGLACDLSKFTSSNQANNGNSSNSASPSPPREMRTPTPDEPSASGFTATLRKMKGKYPSETMLLENAEMNSRLKKLLGAGFSDLRANFGTEMPIEIESDVFLAHACEPHNCGGNEYFIYVDLKSGNVNVYRVIEGRAKTFFEDGKISLPPKFADDMSSAQ